MSFKVVNNDFFSYTCLTIILIYAEVRFNTDGWDIVDRNATKVTIDFDCFIAAEENQK